MFKTVQQFLHLMIILYLLCSFVHDMYLYHKGRKQWIMEIQKTEKRRGEGISRIDSLLQLIEKDGSDPAGKMRLEKLKKALRK